MTTSEKNILIADDDIDDQELLEEAFLNIEQGAVIHTVSSGKEAVEYLQNCPAHKLPCLIVLDYNMPDITGAQLTENICSDQSLSKIPVLVWSTSDSFLYRQECERKGARQYFYKPNNFSQVIEMAKKMLDFC
jgi:CheY-like chemotaxis protein